MAEKKQQILDLDPSSEMVFKGPFTDVVTATLKLSNPTNDTVIFKVKTTAPKQYCVRPNSGMLNPHESADIAVMLQPFDPHATDTQKHKFMVQTMIAPNDFTMEQLDNVWKLASKGDLMDSKLKCTFVDVSPEEQPNSEETVTTSKVQGGESADVGDIFSSSTVETPKPASSEERTPPSQPTAGSTPGPQKQDKNQIERETMETKVRQLQQKLDKLTTENTQLKGEANKLKQRVATAGSAAAGKIKPQISHSSSSLNIVAIMLILVAIILGYLVGKWL
ncbi:vesicle-associated membrane protein/synaptobrevin-binding protein-like [Halichondria panicea]|uniref:vesicle-associated membrane protein/synaptobrevin-binding protein-like n=1 Tax=Halichondria panicea TaxID=6063 RepID=UPI00312B829A